MARALMVAPHLTVEELGQRYRDGGPATIGDRRHANRGGPPLLDGAQQERLRTALAGSPPDGGIWSCRSVAGWMSPQLARPVSPQRGWE